MNFLALALRPGLNRSAVREILGRREVNPKGGYLSNESL